MISFGVPWDTWEPVYEAIVADFEFDRGADEAARDELIELLAGRGLSPEHLPVSAGKTVAIAGAAPTISEEMEHLTEADLVFAASTASEVLIEAGIPVDIHVTDLDKDGRVVAKLAEDGVPIAVHAHGDNRDLLETAIPGIEARVFPTTQARPKRGIYNPGGFTDGDRAAFLADALGAAEVTFAGWSFDDPQVTSEKRRKLAWAERLLLWLEQRRGDRFDVLDGRRDRIELPGAFDTSRAN